ncbi:halocyanin [Halostella sp. JP-L12]|uniref:plastocyanin/azurin family copper-binding protein n=1 Tax=Halostella TaxID=1843185 RepID=UPI000EF78FFF|nr:MULTISPECIES: plastocyanin/azurin family copper-binding protein [Halostella]NHN49222.1 halocyanin [Halostella sp. JP-L12]
MSRRTFVAAGVTTAGATAGTAVANATQETQTVELVDYAYEPGTDEPLVIAPGTTVRFVWITDNHNIAVDSQPDEAEWEGHQPIENADFEYEHTFEVEGVYEFHCDPHQSLGMAGTIEVREGGASEEEGGPVEDLLPDEALTVGIWALGALLVIVFFAYFFTKYSGDYGE